MEKKDLVMLFTGDGKGKTTAAFGLMMRQLGWGNKVCCIQFLKSEEFVCGERLFCEKMGIETIAAGIGYSWTKSPAEQKEAVAKAWTLAKEKIESGEYNLIVLDEILGVMVENKIPLSEVVTVREVMETLKNRPKGLDVALTGRGAPEDMIAFADLVTEMKAVKHPYEKGIPAQQGIEY